MKVGDVVRYDAGPTALMQIEYVSPNHGGFGDRFFGLQCMGGSCGAYASSCSPATEKDMATWRECAVAGKWRRRDFKPVERSIVGVVED